MITQEQRQYCAVILGALLRGLDRYPDVGGVLARFSTELPARRCALFKALAYLAGDQPADTLLQAAPACPHGRRPRGGQLPRGPLGGPGHVPVDPRVPSGPPAGDDTPADTRLPIAELGNLDAEPPIFPLQGRATVRGEFDAHLRSLECAGNLPPRSWTGTTSIVSRLTFLPCCTASAARCRPSRATINLTCRCTTSLG